MFMFIFQGSKPPVKNGEASITEIRKRVEDGVSHGVRIRISPELIFKIGPFTESFHESHSGSISCLTIKAMEG